MRQFVSSIGKALLPAGAALLLGAAPQPQLSGERISHTVAHGESVSLICIDYYGYYSDMLGQAVLALNPSVKSIDLIYAGQVLALRKPLESLKGPAAAPKQDVVASVAATSSNQVPATDDEPLFVKKMSVMQGVVTCVEGTVTWRRNATAASVPLKINTVVSPGNVIETGGEGRVEIIINRESAVRIREHSRVVLEGFRSTSGITGDKTRVGCGVGTLWTKVKKFRDSFSRFELELPTAIAGVHGTVYETVVSPDSSAEVKVFSGEVAVRNAAAAQRMEPPQGEVSEVAGPHEIAPPQEVTMERWTQTVRSMQKLAIDKKGHPGAPVAFSENGGSDWEKWNRERDRRIAALFGESDR